MSTSASATVYKLKTVEFIGRKVSIVLQNKNGPCPLLAIANVLLLRNQVYLPLEAADVSQDRLIALVANHLLEANSEEALRDRVDEEYRVNLHRNIEDAIALLPKLTTGVDVNPRFSSIKAFEFTDETAIFDLLDISLVHGWLVDAQDPQAREAVGEMSYNELVTKLATLLGAATPKHLTSRPPSARALRTPSATSQAEGSSRFDMRAPVSPHTGAEAACPTPTATPAASMELPSPMTSLEPPMGPSRLGATESDSNQATLATLTSAAEAITEDDPAESAHQDARGDEAGLDLDAEDSATLQEALALSVGPPSAAVLGNPPETAAVHRGSRGAALSPISASNTAQRSDQPAKPDLPTPQAGADPRLQPSALDLKPMPATLGDHPGGAAPLAAACDVNRPDTSGAIPRDIEGLVAQSSLLPAGMSSDVELRSSGQQSASGPAVKSLPGQHLQQQEHSTATPAGLDGSIHHDEPLTGTIGHPAHSAAASLPHEAGTAPEAHRPPGSAVYNAEGQTAADPAAAETEAAGIREVQGEAGLEAAGAGPESPAAGMQAAGAEAELASKRPVPAQPPGIAEAQASEQELPPSSPIAGPSTPSTQATPAHPSRTPEQKARDVAEARLLQDFLESTSNQLTYSGLEGLLKGLRPNELAVFFRNNHFNTVFLHKGSLHILVTDMGYLAHPDVVWERLDSVQGDTEYLTGSFASHRDKAFAEEVSRAAKLTQAAFSDVIPPAPESGTSHDQDFALALQLQEEERDRDRRRLQQQQAQQQQQQQQRSAARPADKPATAQARQQQQGSTSRNVVPSARAQQQQQQPQQQQQASASQQGQRQSRSKGKGMCVLM